MATRTRALRPGRSGDPRGRLHVAPVPHHWSLVRAQRANGGAQPGVTQETTVGEKSQPFQNFGNCPIWTYFG